MLKRSVKIKDRDLNKDKSEKKSSVANPLYTQSPTPWTPSDAADSQLTPQTRSARPRVHVYTEVPDDFLERQQGLKYAFLEINFYDMWLRFL